MAALTSLRSLSCKRPENTETMSFRLGEQPFGLIGDTVIAPADPNREPRFLVSTVGILQVGKFFQ